MRPNFLLLTSCLFIVGLLSGCSGCALARPEGEAGFYTTADLEEAAP